MDKEIENCYYDLGRNEFMEELDDIVAVIEMLYNPYCPEWMPEAIMKAIDCSKSYESCGNVFLALVMKMGKIYFIREDIFIRELIHKLNMANEHKGEYSPVLNSIFFWDIYGSKKITLDELRKIQKRLQKEHTNDFDEKITDTKPDGKAA